MKITPTVFGTFGWSALCSAVVSVSVSAYRRLSIFPFPPQTQTSQVSEVGAKPERTAEQTLQFMQTWMMNQMRRHPYRTNRTKQPRPNVIIELGKLAQYNRVGRPLAIVDGSFRHETSKNHGWAVIALKNNVPFFIAYGSDLAKQELNEPGALLNAIMALARTGYSSFHYLTDDQVLAKKINEIIAEKGDALLEMDFSGLVKDHNLMLAKYIYTTNSTIEHVNRSILRVVDFPALYASVKMQSGFSFLPFEKNQTRWPRWSNLPSNVSPDWR